MVDFDFEFHSVNYELFFRNAKDDHKLDEPLSIKIDDCSTILEVDQPSTSSGLGPSPVEDCSSPKQVTIWCLDQLEIQSAIPKAICLLLMLSKSYIPSIFISSIFLIYTQYILLLLWKKKFNSISIQFNQSKMISDNNKNNLKVSLSSLNSPPKRWNKASSGIWIQS